MWVVSLRILKFSHTKKLNRSVRTCSHISRPKPLTSVKPPALQWTHLLGVWRAAQSPLRMKSHTSSLLPVCPTLCWVVSFKSVPIISPCTVHWQQLSHQLLTFTIVNHLLEIIRPILPLGEQPDGSMIGSSFCLLSIKNKRYTAH